MYDVQRNFFDLLITTTAIHTLIKFAYQREHTKAVRPIDHSLEHNSLKHMKQTLPIYLLHRKYHSTFTKNTNLSNLSYRLEKTSDV